MAISQADMEAALDILNHTYPYHPMADVTSREPFKVLICCLLSLRSLDRVTMPACTRLFMVADTPEKILKLSREELIDLVYPVRYYAAKADTLQSVSRDLLERFNGDVPDNMDDLLSIKGVGRKTANLVLALGFNLPAICVDTHVHRITNRLGYVHTRKPDETEQVLREKLPRRYWKMINRVMVRHGQEICLPIHPRCEICPVNCYCLKIGVKTSATKAKPGELAPKETFHS